MRELLKISHGYYDEQRAGSLCNYELCIHEGDIFYIQGLEGTGIRTLLRIIAGDCRLERGSLFLWEERVEEYDRGVAKEKGIYVISGADDLVEEMTVADNLEAVRAVPFPFLSYDSRRAVGRAEEYLKREQVEIPADAYVWSLKRGDRQKLSILKARMHGAKLIVLDVTGYICEGIEAEELCGLIRDIHREGISFLILSECYSSFAEIASRIQILSQGRDIKEWTRMTDRVRQILRYQITAIPEQEGQEPFRFVGMYDYEWEMREGFWEFLRQVRRHNPALWEEWIGGEVPEDGCGRRGDTVVVPADSAELLLNHLTISDNLLLPNPDRVARRRMGIIRGRIEENIVARYLEETGVPPGVRYPEELGRVQRKILSIYRYALGRPKRMILENPYLGLNFYETRTLRDYLGRLKERGTAVAYFSKNRQEFREDCGWVLVTSRGERGKISTIS